MNEKSRRIDALNRMSHAWSPCLMTAAVLAVLMSVQVCRAVSVTPEELDKAHRWSGIFFEGVQMPMPADFDLRKIQVAK